MICSVCAIGLYYVILKFLSVNLFLWGHELANSFLLFSVHKSFLQIITDFFRQLHVRSCCCVGPGVAVSCERIFLLWIEMMVCCGLR